MTMTQTEPRLSLKLSSRKVFILELCTGWKSHFKMPSSPLFQWLLSSHFGKKSVLEVCGHPERYIRGPTSKWLGTRSSAEATHLLSLKKPLAAVNRLIFRHKYCICSKGWEHYFSRLQPPNAPARLPQKQPFQALRKSTFQQSFCLDTHKKAIQHNTVHTLHTNNTDARHQTSKSRNM